VGFGNVWVIGWSARRKGQTTDPSPYCPCTRVQLTVVLFVLIGVVALGYYGPTAENWQTATSWLGGEGQQRETETIPWHDNHADFNPDSPGDETWDNYIATHTSTTSLHTPTPVATVEDTSIAPSPVTETEPHTVESTQSPESHTHVNTSTSTTEPKLLYSGPPIRSQFHQRYLTLATMFKNQRRWLREWIEFNLLVGIEHFIIYDNESTDLPLEILQPYIDQGYVTYIPWPPQEVPPPIDPDSYLEQDQDEWFQDCLKTCLYSNFTMHKQGPCQMAAFIDAIRRTKGGVSRWLAIWDIDEYIFPRRNSVYQTLPEILRERYADATVVRVWGNVFGTSGHVEHAARRKEGDTLQALMTENYLYRAELDRTDPHVNGVP
jgi:hypothetical protein